MQIHGGGGGEGDQCFDKQGVGGDIDARMRILGKLWGKCEIFKTTKQRNGTYCKLCMDN
jgi:hypothetical protein